ncbi:NAD(P)-binding protein [Viridothelium virens]|uniref:NAD(P)-binding protein n=1 Tax=Viridothelium virens TaxID=1048519 RepID=A0A6A6HQ96_VIRVR|nr:NAD(P)-binding protein [Viridothelium virens]
MSAIKSVAVAGATGNLGPSIVTQLVEAGFTVTTLTRLDSKSAPPSGTKAIPVDYTSVASLTAALQGQDAVVSALSPAVADQIPLIDAAIAAGVKRFLPSEFGCDTLNANAAKLPVFGRKVQVHDYLAEKAKDGKVTYTLMMTGAFLDWALGTTLIVDLKGGVTSVYDGGDRESSMTTLPDIGRAVVGVLKHPKETENRAVYTQSASVTQNRVLAIANKVAGKKYETKPASTVEVEKDAHERVKKGDMSAMYDFLRRALWGEGFGSSKDRSELDNDLVGVKELTEKQLEELIAKYA